MCSAIPDGYEHSMISACLAGDKESQDFFNKWNEEVMATVPKERLLVFEAKQGYGPLCEFLGVPVPEGEEYPRVNDTAEFRGKVDKIKIVSYGILVVLSIVAAMVIKRFF